MSDEGSESYFSRSSGLTSSKSSSSDSLDGDTTEHVRLGGIIFRLPRSLISDKSIFKEFFSMSTWWSLPDNFQACLKSKFMPYFPENDEKEKDSTLQQLFNHQIERFGQSPMDSFRINLEEGNYRPDITKLRSIISQSRRREHKFQQCERLSQLSRRLALSREKLLNSAYNSSPECQRPNDKLHFISSLNNQNNAAMRARKRYVEEVTSVYQKVGLKYSPDDMDTIAFNSTIKAPREIQTNISNENKIIGTMSTKHVQKRFLMSGDTISNDNLRDILLAHKKRKMADPERPEYETNDIRLRDVHARTQISGTFRKFNSKKLGRKSSKKCVDEGGSVVESSKHELKPTTDGSAVTPLNVDYEKQPNSIELVTMKTSYNNESEVDQSSSTYSQNMDESSKRKRKIPVYPRLNPFSTDLNEIITNKNVQTETEGTTQSGSQSEITTNIFDCEYERVTQTGRISEVDDFDNDLNEPQDIEVCKASNNTESALEETELTQDTHVCFFSLIRDIFCSTSNHRIKLEDLRMKVCSWLLNPITALNDWYGHADNWVLLIHSAVYFLAGDFADQPDDFVPYLEFKTNLDIYQWIGAGRDSDQHLLQLYNYWLSRRHEMDNKPNRSSQDSVGKALEIEDVSLDEKIITPPPPKFPTAWTVQAYNANEINDFRAQEKRRFENPHRAFTYKMHGYESVVGPVKGIYTQIFALTKARGHNMLVADRPNFVTILTLVRDATARLPNGEGTRADICELLKSSQYINPKAQDSILQTIVSGALDRMHTEHDPCVKYDPKRKIWIYLHRNRTEEEFEKLHQQYQGVGKNKKPTKKIKQKLSKTNSAENISAINTTINSGSVPSKLAPAKVLVNQASLQALTNSNCSPIHTLPKTNVRPELVPIKPNIIISENHRTLDDVTTMETHSAPNIASAYSRYQNLPALIVESNLQQKISATKKTVPHPASALLQVDQDAYSISNIGDGALASSSSVNAQINSALKLREQPMKLSSIEDTIQSTLLDKRTVKSFQMIENHMMKPFPQVICSTQDSMPPTKSSEYSKPQTVEISSINSTLNVVKPVLSIGSNVKQSLVRATTKPLLRVASTTPAGKSLISPHVAATNITLQQQQKLLSSVNNMAGIVTQKHSFEVPTVQNSRNQQKPPTCITNTKTNQTLTFNQQKQPIQGGSTVMCSKPTTMPTQRHVSISVSNAIMIPNSPLTQSVGNQGKQFIISQHSGIQQLQKVVNSTTNTIAATSSAISLTPSNSANVTNANLTTTLTNPQFIRIQQAGQCSESRLHPINSANITENQIIIQNLAKQQKIQQSQSVIIRPQTIYQQTQKQSPQIIPSTSSASTSSKPLTQLPTTVKDKFINVTNTKPDVGMTYQQISAKPPQTVTRVIKSGGSILNANSLANMSGLRAQVGNPVMAKVITNSNGQIISLESLIQKQISNTAVRITGTKSNQANVIQIGGHNPQIPQYTVVSQARSHLSTSNVSRLAVGSSSGNLTTNLGPILNRKPAEITSTKLNQDTTTSHSQVLNTTKVAMTNQVCSLPAPQIINAKILGKSSGNFRMVNASNLNIAHIRGKPVIIASRPSNITNQQNNQGVMLQSSINSGNVVIGAQTLKLQGNVISPANVQVFNQSASSQSQAVFVGNQIIKVQQAIPIKSQSCAVTASNITTTTLNSASGSSPQPSTLTSSNNPKSSTNNPTNIGSTGPKAVIIGSAGKTIRMQPSVNIQSSSPQTQQLLLGSTLKGTTLKNAATGQQRVVFAVQGGGQLILPQGFQGGAINLKAVQGLKVLSVTQQPNKDVGDRSALFAQIMPPQQPTGSPNGE